MCHFKANAFDMTTHWILSLCTLCYMHAVSHLGGKSTQQLASGYAVAILNVISVLGFTMLRNTMLCYVMLCYVVLCYAILCYALLRYAVL